MTALRYNVIYRGKILPEFDYNTAKSKLISTFALSEEKAEKILKSSRVILKKGTDEATARKIGTALKRSGLDIVLAKSEPAPLTEKAGPVQDSERREPDLPKPQEPAAFVLQGAVFGVYFEILGSTLEGKGLPAIDDPPRGGRFAVTSHPHPHGSRLLVLNEHPVVPLEFHHTCILGKCLQSRKDRGLFRLDSSGRSLLFAGDRCKQEQSRQAETQKRFHGGPFVGTLRERQTSTSDRQRVARPCGGSRESLR